MPYNTEVDADRFLAEIKREVKSAILRDDMNGPGPESSLITAFAKLEVFVLLYGFRFDLADHLHFIHVGFEALYQENVDSTVVASIASVNTKTPNPL